MANEGAVNLGDASNIGVTSTPLTLSASGIEGRFGIGNVRFTMPTLDGFMEEPTQFPMLTLEATMVSGRVAALDATLPALDVSGTILNGSAASGNITLPALTLDASTGTAGEIDMPALTVAGVAVNGASGAADILLPGLSLSGSALQHNTAVGEITFQPLTLAATATASGVLVGSVTLPAPSLSATAVSGNTGVASLTIPMLTLDADGQADGSGTANIILPMLQLGVAGGVAAQLVQTLVAPVFSGVMLNTRNHAVTTYDGIKANSLCEFNGVTLMATADGIVALTGDTDNGVAIPAHLKGGVSDFGDEHMKRVLAGYVGYRADGEMELTLITDDHHEYVYQLSQRRIDEQHATRVKFGKGIAGRYWQWKLANANGSDFALDALTFETLKLGRKV